jgi:hypothetical protein
MAPLSEIKGLDLRERRGNVMKETRPNQSCKVD